MNHNTLINHENVRFTGGFWKQKQDMIRDVTLGAVYDRFKETRRFEALNCKPDPADPSFPHIFYDSDTAKWIESAAYVLEQGRNPGLEAKVDEMVDTICANQLPNGYFQSHFLTCEPENVFTRQFDHELYCMGHLMEAAVAYDKATGKDKLLRAACRMADCIERAFVIEKTAKFPCSGHEEIELALVRLYEHTGEKRYLRLSEHFLNVRGVEPNEKSDWLLDSYFQAHKPVREQDTAEGHAVRAVYLYNGMARVADKTSDEGLYNACRRLFRNITERRMYVTGGIGSSHVGEAFTVDYHLPNLTAYTESCAALGLALFANQMNRLDANAKYSDVIERIIYNGFLSSVSLDGRSFFYENPLEIDPALHKKDVSVQEHMAERFPIMERLEVFGCSCCPPNITRFIASLGDLMYSTDGGTVFVNQYAESESAFEAGGRRVSVTQKTAYPYDGNVELTVEGASELRLRIPGWCRAWTVSLDGAPFAPLTENGYAAVPLDGGRHTLRVRFEMPVERIAANPAVQYDAGRIAVTRGPLVYCLEGVDNGTGLRDVRLPSNAVFSVAEDAALGVQVLKTVGMRRGNYEGAPLYAPVSNDLVPAGLTFIPYFAFANRGATEMIVWILPC